MQGLATSGLLAPPGRVPAPELFLALPLLTPPMQTFLLAGSVYSHAQGAIQGKVWLINGEGLMGCIACLASAGFVHLALPGLVPVEGTSAATRT